MARPKEKTRIYYIADATMLELAKTKHGFFLEDKAKFVQFDADFQDPYAANYLAKISGGEQKPTDERVTDQLTDLTKTVVNKMEACRAAYQTLKFFVEKAFPDNLPVQNEFGFDNYIKAQRSQARMILFMEEVYSVALKYKSDLLAKNYSQQQIDALLTLKQQLDTANTVQELAKGGRPTLTQDRIEKLNDVWTIMKNICKAGKIIFEKDAAKYNRYTLPAGAETENEEPTVPAPLPQG